MPCECHLFNKSDKNTFKFLCQNKVNNNLITMKEEQDTCKDRGPPVEITNEEFERLKKYGIKKVINLLLIKKQKKLYLFNVSFLKII